MKKFKYFKLIRNIIIVVILLYATYFTLKTAPYYKNSETAGMTNLIINNNNVTSVLKKNIIIKDDVIFLSEQDVANFFDIDIYYNPAEKRIVTTSNTKVASLLLNNPKITINNTPVTLKDSAFQANDTNQTIYLPFSELKNVYNIEINYNKDSDIITVDSLSREQIKANISKNVNVKSYARTLSKTISKLTSSDTVVFISSTNGWSKIRTSDGTIGYIPDKYITNQTKVRENDVPAPPQVEGKINMVWDYYYSSAPDRTGIKIDGVNIVAPSLFALDKSNKGALIDKVGDSGQKYIEWAKSNNYKIWGLISNESINGEPMLDITSQILSSYSLRTKLINNIVNSAVQYNLDGVNIDFEPMYADDKNMFSQFIIELYPRLKEKNIVLSVDVTAPDGGDIWSLCFNRLVIGRNCDYVAFMAYDQYGSSSTKPGTTAGYDWIMTAINKFLKSGGSEEVPAEKLILGLPFYTRVWTVDSSGKIITGGNNIVSMKDINNVIPKSATITWLDDVKQNYAEWKSGNNTKKIWIEDEQSMRAKLSIITTNNLAGAAFWDMNREPSSIWTVINEELH